MNILKWIYTDEFEFDTRHKAVSKPSVKNSGEWFLKWEAYNKWIDGSESNEARRESRIKKIGTIEKHDEAH